MAVRDLIEIFVSFVQYFLLLVAVKPSPYPWYYGYLTSALSFVNLDFRSLFSRGGVFASLVGDSVPLDIRLQFTIVSVGFPLLLAVGTLLLLAPKLLVVWFTVLIVGVIFFTIGMFSTVVRDQLVNATLSTTLQQTAIYIGASLCVVCGVAAVVYRFFCDLRSRKRNRIELIESDETAGIDWAGAVFRFVYILLFTFFGLMFVGAFSIPSWFDPTTLGRVAVAIGGALLGIAGLLSLWTLASFSLKGRVLQFQIGNIVQKHFLSVLFVMISLVYVAAVSNIFFVFNCDTITCASGYTITQPNSAIVPNTTMTVVDPVIIARSTTNVYCEPCTFTASPQACPAAEQFALCGQATAYDRLWSDGFVPCSPLQRYFWAAGVIMLLSFVFSMPVVNYILTQRSTRIIHEDFPLDARQTIGYNDEEVFNEKVFNSDNVAKFIYDPFHFRWRHWRMLFLFQKLIVVFFSVFVVQTSVFESDQVAITVSTFIHFLCLVYVAVTRPFKRKVENMLTITTQMVLVVAGIFGTMGANGTGPPDAVMIGFGITACVAPVVSLIVGAILTVRETRARNAVREKRIQQALQEVRAEEEGSTDAVAPTKTASTNFTLDDSKPTARKGRECDDVFIIEADEGLSVSPKKLLSPKSVEKSGKNKSERTASITSPESGDQSALKQSGSRSLRIDIRTNVLVDAPHHELVSPRKAIPDSPRRSGGNPLTIAPRGQRFKKNTASQSERARRRWKAAKEYVMKIVHSERLKTRQNGAPGPLLSPRKKKGATAWDSMMFLLLQKTATDASAREKKKLEAIQSSLKQASGTDNEENVRKRMAAFYEEHLKKVKSQQKACDFRINDETISVLQVFFIIMGVFSFVAVGCCALGFLSYSQGPRFISFDVSGQSTYWQLADYPSWKDFADNCCCLGSANQTLLNPSTPYVDVERWMCANGHVKERLRTWHDGENVHSTLSVRALCATEFVSSCAVRVVGDVPVLSGSCVTALDPHERVMW